MSSISSIITAETNYTKQLEAATDTVTGPGSMELGQADFLKLLTQQLQFQDPMEPQDNSQFISQMCQFSQLEVSTDTYEVISDYTGEAQANSLVGYGVVLEDPKDKDKVITGTVDAAYLDGDASAITVDGKTYSLDYLLYSYNPSAVTADQSTSK